MKRAGALLLGAALTLSISTCGMAEESKKVVGLEIHGMYAGNFNDDETQGSSVGSDADKTFGGGASLVFSIGKRVKLDLGGDYLQTKNKENGEIKAQLIPFAGTFRIGAPIQDVAFLYVGGGLGYSINKWNIKGEESSDLELRDCVTYHACGGGELLFDKEESIGLRLEFRYVWMKPTSKDNSTEDEIDIKFDHVQIRGGLIFNF